jgi:hypothetical protein
VLVFVFVYVCVCVRARSALLVWQGSNLSSPRRKMLRQKAFAALPLYASLSCVHIHV